MFGKLWCCGLMFNRKSSRVSPDSRRRHRSYTEGASANWNTIALRQACSGASRLRARRTQQQSHSLGEIAFVSHKANKSLAMTSRGAG